MLIIFVLDSACAWPPCLRVIIQETGVKGLNVGTLFIVTCTGGTMGREGDHSITIPDINISKVSLIIVQLNIETPIDMGCLNIKYNRLPKVPLKPIQKKSFKYSTVMYSTVLLYSM